MDTEMAIQRALFQSDIKPRSHRLTPADNFEVRLATQEEFDRYISIFPNVLVSNPNANLSD